MSIILTILILGIIIFVHELGHFLSAKYFKMPVSEFSLGMGPKLFGFEKGETAYNLRAIPMGGYVKIEGMEIEEEKVENGFATKKPFQRFIVLFAGVFMNFILALIIVFFLVFFNGESTIKDEAIIGNISKGSVAEGLLKKGDRILLINDEKVKTWYNVTDKLKEINEKEVNILLDREGQEIKVKTKMKYNKEYKKYLIGISPVYIKIKYKAGEFIKVSLKEYVDLFKLNFKGLKLVFTGKVSPKEIAGPIGTVKAVKMFSAYGPANLIYFIAIISISVGIFNLLPFPALDGGRIVFVIIEMFGIKINKKLEENVHRVGLTVLLCLIILISGNDIINIFNK